MDILDKIDFFVKEPEYTCEGVFKQVVRGGKVIRKLICPAGTKAVGGKCVFMKGSERLKRSKASKKAQRKLAKDPTKKIKMEKKRAKSLKKRHSRVPKDATNPGQQMEKE